MTWTIKQMHKQRLLVGRQYTEQKNFTCEGKTQKHCAFGWRSRNFKLMMATLREDGYILLAVILTVFKITTAVITLKITTAIITLKDDGHIDNIHHSQRTEWVETEHNKWKGTASGNIHRENSSLTGIIVCDGEFVCFDFCRAFFTNGDIKIYYWSTRWGSFYSKDHHTWKHHSIHDHWSRRDPCTIRRWRKQLGEKEEEETNEEGKRRKEWGRSRKGKRKTEEE